MKVIKTCKCTQCKCAKQKMSSANRKFMKRRTNKLRRQWQDGKYKIITICYA